MEAYRSYTLIKLAALVMVLALLFMPLSDLTSVYARSIGESSLERASLFYRMVMLGVISVISLSVLTKKRLYFWLFFLFLEIFFLVYSLFFLGLDEYSFESSLMLLKFFVFFLFFDAFYITLKMKVISKKMLFSLIDFLIFVYSSSIVIGAILGVDNFKYYSGDRWGVKGIIISGNEASGFLLIAISWCFLKYRFERGGKLLALVVLAIIFSGTKAAYLGFIFVSFSYFYSVNPRSSISYSVIFFGFFGFFSYLMYFFSPSIQDAFQGSYSYFEYQFYNSADGSWLTLLLSGRDFKLEVVLDAILTTSPWSILFGGFPIAIYSVEMDLFDLIGLIGIVGAGGYFALWLKCWFNKVSKSPFEDVFKLHFVLIFIALGFTGGHMFYSAMAAPFLAALAIRFRLGSSDLYDKG